MWDAYICLRFKMAAKIASKISCFGTVFFWKWILKYTFEMSTNVISSRYLFQRRINTLDKCNCFVMKNSSHEYAVNVTFSLRWFCYQVEKTPVAMLECSFLAHLSIYEPLLLIWKVNTEFYESSLFQDGCQYGHKLHVFTRWSPNCF